MPPVHVKIADRVEIVSAERNNNLFISLSLSLSFWYSNEPVVKEFYF